MYEGLAEKHLYRLSREEVEINDDEVDEDIGEKIKSYKNLDLRDATITVLQDTEDMYEGNERYDC